MKQPKGWGTFIQNDDAFRWFCLTCRDTGIAASERLHIGDEVSALDFDNAVSLRLLRFDAQRAKHHANLVAQATWGKKEDILDATELHPLAQDDPYADKNTIIS